MLGTNNREVCYEVREVKNEIFRVRVSVIRGQENSPGPAGSAEEQGFQVLHLLPHLADPRTQGGWDPQQNPEPWNDRRLRESEEEWKAPKKPPPSH